MIDPKSIAPLILRIGFAAFFLWFGAEQLLHGLAWVGWVPEWAVDLFGMSPAYIVMANGFFEILCGVMLAFGIFTRWVALALALHTCLIAFEIGVTAIGARDAVIAVALFSLALYGKDELSLF